MCSATLYSTERSVYALAVQRAADAVDIVLAHGIEQGIEQAMSSFNQAELFVQK
jgi:hypothetical protein